MSIFQRTLIETRLQNFEAGRFQEFVLRLLPLYDLQYVKMIRHGHTEGGKTRKGVPDLIKTFDNGNQIGCECGTAEDYWTPPKEASNYPSWKPIEDAQKCIDKMSKPIEVILASNRPIPTNHPNAKTLIIDYFSSSGIKIHPLTSADLASWVELNLKNEDVLDLAAEFFPEAVENILLEDASKKLDAAIEIGDEFGLPTKGILDIIRSSSGIDETLLKEKIETEIFGENRFTHSIPETFKGINRYDSYLPKPQDLLGRIALLLGAPKIGKTNLAWEAIKISKTEYKWFSTPFESRLEDEFLDALFIAIYTRKLTHKEALKQIRSSGGFSSTEVQGLESDPITIVVDNIHLLTDTGIGRLKHQLADAKSKGLLKNVFVLFLSNKNITNLSSILSDTFVAPAWEAKELEKLVVSRGIKIEDPDPQQYWETLQIQSGGHPLFAIALAGKYPDRAKLILNSIKSPGTRDPELSNEIKSVLYQDILTSPDKQNFVQRLSLLTAKSDELVLDAIRTEVEPQILTTSPNLIDEIGPAVIEGTLKEGVKISPTFRNVQKGTMTKTEVESVFEAAARAMLTIEGKTINADKWIDGIFYLTMAGKLGHAAGKALFLLYGFFTDKKSERDIYLSYLLDRLSYFKILKSDDLPDMDYLTLSALRMMLAHYHSSLRQFKEANDYLSMIDLNRIEKANPSPAIEGIDDFRSHLLLAVTSSGLLSAFESNDPYPSISAYLEYKIKYKASASFSIDDFIPELVRRLKIHQFSKFDFKDFAIKSFQLSPSTLLDSAVTIGYAVKNDDDLKNKIVEMKSAGDLGAILFALIAESSWNSNTDLNKDAIQNIEQALKEIEKANLKHDELGSLLFQHMGDTYFANDELDKAISYFQISTDNEDDKDSFVTGWNYFKIGLSSSDDKTVVDSLQKSAEVFETIGDFEQGSRACGALGAHYLKNGELQKAIEIGEKLATWYHTESRNEVSASIRLFTAQTLQVVQEAKGNPHSFGGQALAPIDKKFYLTISRDLKPEAGGVVTFQALSQLAEHANLPEKQKALVKKGLYSEITHQMDRQAIILNWTSLYFSISPEEFDENEFNLLLHRIAQCQPAPNTDNEKMFMIGILKPFEERAKSEPANWAPILINVVRLTSRHTENLSESMARRWDPYLDFSEGLYHQLGGNKREAVKFYRRVMDRAIADKNWSIGEDAAFAMSFPLWEGHSSMLEAAQSHYDLFRCIEGSGLSQEKVTNLGRNLFRFWGMSQWRRISTKDLNVNKLLSKSGQELLGAGYSEIEAAPIMVALLLKCFEHQENYSELLTFTKEPPKDISDLIT